MPQQHQFRVAVRFNDKTTHELRIWADDMAHADALARQEGFDVVEVLPIADADAFVPSHENETDVQAIRRDLAGLRVSVEFLKQKEQSRLPIASAFIGTLLALFAWWMLGVALR